MADNDTANARSAPTKKSSFRTRYNAAERRRLALVARLNGLDERRRAHPSFGKAMTLLTRTFREAKLVQRAAILQAADWLIGLIEMGPPFL
jgi:hypothetical protein